MRFCCSRLEIDGRSAFWNDGQICPVAFDVTMRTLFLVLKGNPAERVVGSYLFKSIMAVVRRSKVYGDTQYWLDVIQAFDGPFYSD